MIVTSINLSTINLRADEHLRTIEWFKEQPPIVVPPYWYGWNPYAFPMGTLMMSMSMNANDVFINAHMESGDISQDGKCTSIGTNNSNTCDCTCSNQRT